MDDENHSVDLSYLDDITDVTEFRRVYRTAKKGEFSKRMTIKLEKEYDLRYGENPNQPAAVYRLRRTFIDRLFGRNKGISIADLTNIHLVKSGKEGLSATNLMDVTRALDILKYFDVPAVSVMKHLIPSGFAVDYDYDIGLDKIYRSARDADARSAFGSIVVFNTPVDLATAEALSETFVEGVAAPGFDEGVIGILGQKKDLRMILYSNMDKIPKYIDDDAGGVYDMKVLPTGRIIVQKPYLSSIKGPESLIYHPMVIDKDGNRHVVARTPTQKEILDLRTAWHVNIGTRSNGIVIVKEGVTLAVGSGQQERVGAFEQAIFKAYQKALNKLGVYPDILEIGKYVREHHLEGIMDGAAMSSDAYIPFRDSIDLAGKHHFGAVIQPGGSVRDFEVIDAANEYKMAMPFTLERCFAHF